MKINFTKQLKDLSGNSIYEPGVKEGEQHAVTLAFVCSAALMQGGDQQKMGWEEKLKRYELALKIRNAKGAIDIPVEDVTMIKKSLSVMPVLYCGQSIKMIEGNG